MPRPLRLLAPLLVFAVLYTATASFYARVASREEKARDQAIEGLRARQVLFLGDSHTQYGIDDRVDPGIADLATSNELYLFTLAKVRRLKPRVAVVSLWVHSFLPYYESRLGRLLTARYDMVWNQLLPDERRELLRRSGFEEAAFIRARGIVPFLGRGIPGAARDPRASFGGFAERGPSLGVSASRALRRFREMTDTRGPFPSSLQVSFLRALLAQLQSDGTEVILLVTPVHEGLRGLIESDWGPRYRELLAEIVRDYRVRLWDESARALPDDHFRDPDHLSARGARRFTRMLVGRLQDEGLLVSEGGNRAGPGTPEPRPQD